MKFSLIASVFIYICLHPNLSGWASKLPIQDDGLEYSDKSIELDQHESTGSGKNPAFMVSLSTSETVSYGRVHWTSVDINENGLFDQSDNSLRISQSGMYFFSITATIESQDTTSLMLDNTGNSIGLFKYGNSSATIDSTTRTGLFLLTNINKPYILQRHSSSHLIGSENGKETSWLGFHYKTNNYLFASRDTSFSSTYSEVPLPNIIAMRGFSKSSNRFRVFEDGYYFVNFGSAVKNSKRSELRFDSTFSSSELYNQIRITNNATTPVIQSLSIIQRLFSGEHIYLKTYEGSQYSNSDHLTYLCSFKLNESLPVFSIASSNEDCSQSSSTVTFRQAPIIDTGNSWHNSGTYRIAVTGTYYIAFNIPSDERNDKIEIYIDINGHKRSRVFKSNNLVQNKFAGYASGGVLMKLSENDNLQLKFVGCIADDGNVGSLTIIFIP
ncbi:DgyrCDS14773 [Dimorphilus gyrociliatus]|uniref:DgyrCDS14773 n=1 Tax=Dimorphilus gyrociliatus TaxID=2664684 RepID=A0A7I8WF09_9ANNE|nr:DgyrCDS14773 [Dimorphilus gyrociliatus]